MLPVLVGELKCQWVDCFYVTRSCGTLLPVKRFGRWCVDVGRRRWTTVLVFQRRTFSKTNNCWTWHQLIKAPEENNIRIGTRFHRRRLGPLHDWGSTLGKILIDYLFIYSHRTRTQWRFVWLWISYESVMNRLWIGCKSKSNSISLRFQF